MCGICGIVDLDSDNPVQERPLVTMRDSLVHRGPDDAGTFRAGGVGLGARRLAILDLSERGHMPMSTGDGRFTIVHNGEIYNYRELRSRLEGRGYRFHSDTDTEVLLNLYADEGPAMLERLNGMWAFAIWDAARRVLFLARDRLGVKPLFYALDSGVLRFASEEKALFAAGLPPSFDESTWEELLCFHYVAGEATPYRGVRRLLPGHYLLWADGSITIRRWWNLAGRARALRDSLPRDPELWFREVFDSAVVLRRISDVPVGVLLSGGLDSSSVAASLAAQGVSGIASFTVGFSEAAYDESPLARRVAESCGFEHHEMSLSPESLGERLVQGSWFRDEPLGHASDLHIWAISQYAKPRVTVLLSGEGADETLGGYVRYRPLFHPTLLEWARPLLRLGRASRAAHGRFGRLARLVSQGRPEALVLFNACDVFPDDLREFGIEPAADFEYRRGVLAEAAALYPGDYVRQAMYNDQHTFLCSILDRNDRMTMGASIECRVPFLDYRLVEGLAALPTRQLVSSRRGKALLRGAIGPRLPAPIRRHRKWGFGVPWTRYFRQTARLRERVEALPDMEPIRSGPLRQATLRQEIRAFLAGKDRHKALIWGLVMIAAWAEACLKPVATPAHRG